MSYQKTIPPFVGYTPINGHANVNVHAPPTAIMPFANASHHLPHPFQDLPDAGGVAAAAAAATAAANGGTAGPAAASAATSAAVGVPGVNLHTSATMHRMVAPVADERDVLRQQWPSAQTAASAHTAHSSGFPANYSTNGHHMPRAAVYRNGSATSYEQYSHPDPYDQVHGNGNGAAASLNRQVATIGDRTLQVGDILERRFSPPSVASGKNVIFKLYGVYIGDTKVMYCLSKDDLLVNTLPWLYPQVQQMCEFARVEIDNFTDWREACLMTPNLDQWTRRSGPGVIKERITKMRNTVRMRRLPLDKSNLGIETTDTMSEERKAEAEAEFNASYALWDSRKFACWIRYGTPFPYPYPYNSAEELQRNLRLLANFLEELRTSTNTSGGDGDSLVEPEYGQVAASDAEATEETDLHH